MRRRTVDSVRVAVVGEDAVDDRRRGAGVFGRGDEVPDRIAGVIGDIHELDTGAVQRRHVGELTDLAVRDPAFDDTERLPSVSLKSWRESSWSANAVWICAPLTLRSRIVMG